jgi:hypothetical protein
MKDLLLVAGFRLTLGASFARRGPISSAFPETGYLTLQPGPMRALLSLQARCAASVDVISDGTCFLEGAYLEASGVAKERVCALIRWHQDERVMVVVPRMVASLVAPGEFPIGQIVCSAWRQRSGSTY